MSWTPWQILVGVALIFAFLMFGSYVKLYDATPIFVALGAGVVLVIGAGAARISASLERSKSEAREAKKDVEIEKARSEMPPALQGAKVEAVRLKMPTLDDIKVRAPDDPATPPAPAGDTNISIEVKS